VNEPTLCPECGGALVVVLTQVRDDGDLHKRVHYRCQDLACVAHFKDAS
jgi:hypothetical protein